MKTNMDFAFWGKPRSVTSICVQTKEGLRWRLRKLLPFIYLKRASPCLRWWCKLLQISLFNDKDNLGRPHDSQLVPARCALQNLHETTRSTFTNLNWRFDLHGTLDFTSDPYKNSTPLNLHVFKSSHVWLAVTSDCCLDYCCWMFSSIDAW